MLAVFTFAGLAALIHVLIFYMESMAWMKPRVHRRFGVAGVGDAERLKSLMYNQGFYNLFLAIGAGAGIGLCLTGRGDAGSALIVFACGSMVAAALVLLSRRPELVRAAVIQGAAPLLALVSYIL